MIQAVLRWIGGAGARRGIGLLLVLAVAVLAVAGAAHVAGADHGDHGAPCTVCHAVLAASGASLPAPSPTIAAVEPRDPVFLDLLLPPLVSEPGRVAAPRGPPARS